MMIWIALVALTNLGLGFALAIHLARQHRSLTTVDTGCPSQDPVGARWAVQLRDSSDTTTVGG
jgi:hypothetical protein